MAPNPLVSIIVPSFNQGKYIRETLDSIFSQDYRPLEVLVIDGGSQDETVSILESFKAPELQWWSEPDNGVTDAVNKGLARAQGDILAIQSSDDIYLPQAISVAVEAMHNQPDAALVYGDVTLMNAESEVIGKDLLAAFDLRHYLGRFSYIPQPSAFFRRDISREIGGWRAEVSYAADADYWLRIAVNHKIVKIDKFMGSYRYHAAQRDVHKARIARDWEKAILDLLSGNKLDKVTRRFAMMGIYLARYRYLPESSWMLRTYYLYRALLANAKAVAHPAFPKRELLPGRQPMWKFLSEIKQGLGFKPRISQSKVR